MADVGVEQELANELRHIYPSWANPEVIDLTEISDGWECQVYSFTLRGEEAGAPYSDALILRTYPGEDGVAKAYREFDVMRRLHSAGFAVPRMLTVVGGNSPIGKPFVVMERIDGEVMGVAMRRSTPGRRRQLLTLFCQLFVELHAFDWRAIVGDPSALSTERYLDSWIAWAEGKLEEFDRHDFLPVLDWLKGESRRVETERLSVTHGDYHPWNILMRRDGRPIIIDWTQTDIADYRMDLAWTMVIMRATLGLAVRDAVLSGYEALVGHVVDDIEFFETAAAFKRLVSIMVAIADGPEKLGMRPGAAITIREQAEHLSTAYAVVREKTGLTLPTVEALL